MQMQSGSDSQSSSKTPLPPSCYSPIDSDCEQYHNCLERRFPYVGTSADYAMKYVTIFAQPTAETMVNLVLQAKHGQMLFENACKSHQLLSYENVILIQHVSLFKIELSNHTIVVTQVGLSQRLVHCIYYNQRCVFTARSKGNLSECFECWF